MYPTLEEVKRLGQDSTLVPVYREIVADLETPVSAYLKLNRGGYSFLLESVEGGERIGRYSFIGTEPYRTIRVDAGENGTDPLAAVSRELKACTSPLINGLPKFTGGAVGYVGYEAATRFEDLPSPATDNLGLPIACFMLADCMLVFDHVTHKIKVVSHVRTGGDTAASYEQAARKIDEMVSRLRGPLPTMDIEASRPGPVQSMTSNFTRSGFESTVARIKEYISAGEAIQVVPSQRLTRPTNARPFEIYRALRTINPSPYMFYLDFVDFQLIGASPEILVRVDGDTVTTRPLAGTRPRGKTPAEDARLEEELRHDEKERAEHIMLVDLGRNDIGRVSRPGTVEVSDLMDVERYSHVMHLVTNVQGKLREGADAFDALRACFPAGTVSGAPKVRAMQIIAEFEPQKRGVYAGAAGYFSFSGNMDMAIAIRTIVLKDRVAYVQAGGGVVYDSVPEREYEESLNKAQATLKAIEQAENRGRSRKERLMLVLIDNYDSFTYNLYQYLCELGADVEVFRNDKITVREIEDRKPERIIISPGPSSPEKAGISNDVVRHFGERLPLLGVCLGHQCIGYSYGGSVSRAARVMHGKSSLIHHANVGVFTGMPNPFSAIRYHSLAVKREGLPSSLEITAWTDDGEIMGIRHKTNRVQGVQFHPESFMTEGGKDILRNFLEG